MKQTSFASLTFEAKKKQTRHKKFLAERRFAGLEWEEGTAAQGRHHGGCDLDPCGALDQAQREVA